MSRSSKVKFKVKFHKALKLYNREKWAKYLLPFSIISIRITCY